MDITKKITLGMLMLGKSQFIINHNKTYIISSYSYSYSNRATALAAQEILWGTSFSCFRHQANLGCLTQTESCNQHLSYRVPEHLEYGMWSHSLPQVHQWQCYHGLQLPPCPHLWLYPLIPSSWPPRPKAATVSPPPSSSGSPQGPRGQVEVTASGEATVNLERFHSECLWICMRITVNPALQHYFKPIRPGDSFLPPLPYIPVVTFPHPPPRLLPDLKVNTSSAPHPSTPWTSPPVSTPNSAPGLPLITLPSCSGTNSGKSVRIVWKNLP